MLFRSDFNLASGKETRIIDLAHKINQVTGNSAGIRYAQRRKLDTKSRLMACIDKARKLIGYEPEMLFEIGLANMIQWFKDSWNNIEDSSRFGPGVSSAVRDMLVPEEQI